MCSYRHTTLYLKLSFHHRIPSNPHFFEHFHSQNTTFAIREIPKTFLEELHTSIKPGVPFYSRYIESVRFALAGIHWPHHDRRRSYASLSSCSWRLSPFSLLTVKCSDAQFTSPHQLVSQQNELRGIESRDWQHKERGTADVQRIDCVQECPVGGSTVSLYGFVFCISVSKYVCVCVCVCVWGKLLFFF